MTNHDQTTAERTALQTEYTFYPTVRRGYRPTSTFDGSTDLADSGSLGVELTVRGSGEDGDRTETASASLRMYGPGDIVGLDRRQVVRVEPSEDADGFPPNQFPHVEFDRPDLPWLFSPQRADDSGRNRPWLALVCVERDRDAVRLDPPGTGPLPVLETPVAELPDPVESWAWTHAQVTGSHDPDDEFARTSDRTVSRLVCPRNLDAAMAYVACVVPTFEPGRRTGLGASVGADGTDRDGNRLSLAWEAGDDGTVRLPVYYSWEFRTGLEGDFESLVRELEPVDFGPEVGYRTIDVGDPGPEALAILAGDDEATVSLGGALKSADAVGDEYGDDHQEAFRTLLNVPEGIDEAVDLPIVGPPTYGKWHAGARTIEPPSSEREGDEETGAYPTWLYTLNTDPQYRVAAALGAETVRDRQEELMASAWAQAGDLGELNDRLRGMQLGRTGMARNLAHLGNAQPEALLQFTTPAQDRMTVSTADLPANHALAGSTTEFVTLQSVLARTSLPDGATSPAFRRLTRSNGPLARRAAASFDADGVVEALATNRGPSVTLDGLDRRVRLDEVMSDESQRGAEEAVGTGGATEESLVEALTDVATGDAEVASDVRFIPDHRQASATEPLPAWLTDDHGEAMTVEEAEAFHAERADADGDDLLVARTVSRVRSASKQALLTRARVLSLRLALPDAESDEQAGQPSRAVQDGQTLVEECERLRSDSLADLEQYLSDLAVDPRPEAVAAELTSDRTAELVDRLRTTHDELLTAVEAVRSALRSDELDRESVLASLDTVDEHLRSILETLETIDGYVDTGPVAPRPSATPEAANADATPATEAPAEFRSQEMSQETVQDDGDLALKLTAVGDGLSSQLDPTAELAQLATDLSGIPGLRDREDPTAEVLARPTFPEPMFRSLAELAPEYLLPGVGSIPKNAIGALVTNPRFVEAYMAGLNHEMARELAWRRFPTDRRGTYFSQFWDHRGNPAAGAADTADVDPLHEWDGNDLGENGPGRRPDDDSDAASERAAKEIDDGATEEIDDGATEEIDDGMVVLLIRGEVLRRYPDTTVYAVKAVEDDGDRVPALPNTHVSRHARPARTEPMGPPETPAPEADIKYPVFRGTIEPDVTFLGFDLSVAEAVAGPYHDGGPAEGVSHVAEDEGWFFVLEEAPGETRFGLDQDQGDVGKRPYGITFTSDGVRETEQLTEQGAEVGWSALSWGHLVTDAGGDGSTDPVAAISHVSVADSRPGRERWAVEAGVRYHGNEDDESEDEWTSADTAEWGANAAHMARITWQQPVRVAIHADDVLPDTEAQTSGGEGGMTDTGSDGEGQ